LRIDVTPTALGLGLVWGLWIEVRVWELGLGLTLTFNTMKAMVMTHTHVKDQGRRSVGSKDRVETDGWLDRWRRLQYFRANAVGKNNNSLKHKYWQ